VQSTLPLQHEMKLLVMYASVSNGVHGGEGGGAMATGGGGDATQGSSPYGQPLSKHFLHRLHTPCAQETHGAAVPLYAEHTCIEIGSDTQCFS
jgi:hypothetical protein